MSLVALRRKAEAMKGVSTKGGFSVNGTVRNLSHIGKTSKISPTRSIYKGLSPAGHGALKPTSTRSCGTTTCSGFPIHILCNNGVSSMSSKCEPTATLSTSGHINQLLNFPKCADGACVKTWVKTFNELDHAQGMYIKNIKTRANTCPTTTPNSTAPSCVEGCKETYFVGSRKMTRSTYHKDANKGSVSSGQYMEGGLLANNCLPPPPCKAPFPMTLNRNGCIVEYLTPEEAIAGGVLPENWMNCDSA